MLSIVTRHRLLREFRWANCPPRVVLIGAVVLCGIIAGCGSGGYVRQRESTVAAAGVLLFQGKPLEYFQVMLTPETGTSAVGVTDEQGKFSLGTNQPGDGALAGQHKVSVVYIGPPGGSYDGINDFSPPPPPKVKIPAKYGNAATSPVRVEIPKNGNKDLKIELP